MGEDAPENKKGLGKKVLDSVKYVVRGTWNSLKNNWYLIPASAIGFYIGYSILPSSDERSKLENQKQEVINYIDKDNSGLSHKEESKIYNLMGIEDSSKTYEPITQDWKRAYDKIKANSH